MFKSKKNRNKQCGIMKTDVQIVFYAVTLVDSHFSTKFFESVPSDFSRLKSLTQNNQYGYAQQFLMRAKSPPVLSLTKLFECLVLCYTRIHCSLRTVHDAKPTVLPHHQQVCRYSFVPATLVNI